jgi:heat shock protein HtpX
MKRIFLFAITNLAVLAALTVVIRSDAALVAVSCRLLRNTSRPVLGHEISHAANGDRVTMALLRGVLNTFVIFPPLDERIAALQMPGGPK